MPLSAGVITGELDLQDKWVKTLTNAANETDRVTPKLDRLTNTVSGKLSPAVQAVDKWTAQWNATLAKFRGDEVTAKAEMYADAVDHLGGASKLTAAQQKELNGVLNQAMAQYEALGKSAPYNMKKLEEATRAVAKPTQETKSFIGELGLEVGKMAAGFISAQAVIGGVEAVFHRTIEFVGESVKAYDDAQRSIKQLTAAMLAQGDASDATVKRMEDLSKQFEDTTIHSDDAIQKIEALFVEIGDVGPQQMQRAIQAAADLSAGLGISLESATRLVAKATEGNTQALGRYGITIDKTQLQMEGMGVVFDAVQKRFGGQAAAELDTYAGKVAQIENKWNNVQEAIGKLIVQNPILIGTLNYTLRVLKDLNGEGDHVTTWIGLLVKHLDQMASIVPGVSLLTFLKAEAAAAEAANKATQELVKNGTIAARLPSPGNVFGTASTQPLVPKVSQSYLGLKLFDPQQDKFSEEEIAKATAAVTKHTAAVKTVTAAVAQLSPEMIRINDLVGKANAEATTRSNDAWKAWTQTVNRFVANLPHQPLERLASRDLSGVAIAVDAVDKHITYTQKATQDWKIGLDELSRGMVDLAQASGGSFGGIAKDLANIVVSWNLATKAATQFKEQSTLAGKAAAVASGIAAVAQATASGSLGARIAGGAISGAAAGAAFGGVGAAVGAAAGAIAGWLRASAQAKTDIAALDNSLVRIYGSLSNATDTAAKFGITLNTAAKGQSGLSALQKGVQALDDTMKALDADTKKYGLTLHDLKPEALAQQIKNLGDTAYASYKRLIQAGYDNEAVIKGMSSDLNDFFSMALRSGQKLTPQMGKLIEQMIRMGQLSEANARALLGLGDSGSLDLAKITEAAGRYGLTLDQLGPKVAQLNIDSQAKQIVDDFNELVAAGAPAETLYGAMGEKVQALVTSALKFGVTLPESMKPLLEGMAAAGDLTDETGKKMTDLSRLTFAQTLTDKIDDLVTALQKFVDVIAGPNGASAALTRLGKVKVDPIDIPYRYKAQNTLPNSPPDVDQKTTGNGSTQAAAAGTMGTAVLKVDGATLARTTVRYMPGVTDLYGAR